MGHISCNCPGVRKGNAGGRRSGHTPFKGRSNLKKTGKKRKYQQQQNNNNTVGASTGNNSNPDAKLNCRACGKINHMVTICRSISALEHGGNGSAVPNDQRQILSSSSTGGIGSAVGPNISALYLDGLEIPRQTLCVHSMGHEGGDGYVTFGVDRGVVIVVSKIRLKHVSIFPNVHGRIFVSAFGGKNIDMCKQKLHICGTIGNQHGCIKAQVCVS